MVLVLVTAGCQRAASETASGEKVVTDAQITLTNPLRGSASDVHVMLFDRPDAEEQAAVTERVLASPVPFNEVLPSWNVDVPEGAGFRMDVRMGHAQEDTWTAWYFFGRWGTAPDADDKHVRDDDGLVDVDVFRSKRQFDRLAYRFTPYPGQEGASPAMRRFAVCLSNTLHDEAWARKHRQTTEEPPRAMWGRRLDVPFRSQRDESPEIAGNICSPTSTSMVMAYRGVDRPTEAMARLIYDADYRIYGNWARAVQGAYVHGVPGYLRRFHDWNEVKACIAAGQPVIASIKDPGGKLRGSPYPHTAGHLLVIVGFDEHGNVHVNDPAGRTPEAGLITYDRQDMEKVWFGYGGVGYILESPKCCEQAR